VVPLPVFATVLIRITGLKSDPPRTPLDFIERWKDSCGAEPGNSQSFQHNLELLHPNCHRQLHSRDAAG